MTKPIEGPWIMGEMNAVGTGPSRIWRIPISGSGLAIASVWCGTVGREYLGMRDQGIAHAELIAAAPTTLAASRAMLAALQELHAFSVERDRLDFMLTRARTLKAEQAIALAKAAGITP